MRTLFAAVAEMELETISERTMDGRRKRAEAGLQPSRTKSPYGYHIVNHKDVMAGCYPIEQTGYYVVIEEQAQRVREIYRRYASGCSLQDLCKWLNSSGVPTPQGGQYWASPTVRLILKNEVNKGVPAFGKWKHTNDESRVSKGFKQTFTQRLKPAEDWIYLKCEPLVDVSLWEYCQKRLAEGRERYSGRPSRKYLLSSILRCPQCGCGMNGSYDKKRDYIRYRCREAMKSRACGEPRCVDRSYNGAKIEGFVLDGLRDVVKRPVLIENALQACKAETASTSQNWADTEGRIKSQLAKITTKERYTVEAQIEAKQVGGSTDIYLSMLKELAQQRLRLTAQLQEAESMQLSQVNETVAVTIAEVLACVDEALSSPEVTDGERHDLLARVVQEVVPVEDGCRIRLTKFPGMETVNNVFTTWNSRQDFLGWVRSEAFTKGHAQSGTLPKDAYPKPNVLEMHEVILEMHEVIQDSARPGLAPEPPGGPFKMH